MCVLRWHRQTDRHTDRQTDGHRDSMTESAMGANLVKVTAEHKTTMTLHDWVKSYEVQIID